MRLRAPSIFFAFIIGSVCIQAQWLNHPTPGTPRTKDGKPNLKASAPRTADGKPDLSGVWMPEPAPLEELAKFIPGHVDGAQTLGEPKPSRYFMNALSDFKPGEIVMAPAADALFKERGDSFGKDLPTYEKEAGHETDTQAGTFVRRRRAARHCNFVECRERRSGPGRGGAASSAPEDSDSDHTGQARHGRRLSEPHQERTDPRA
jgi:hypothetical protein